MVPIVGHDTAQTSFIVDFELVKEIDKMKIALNHQLQRQLFVYALSASAVLQFTACAPLLLGTAALAGKVAIDRRTPGIQVEDEAIELRTASGLGRILPKNTNVKVSSYNRMVLLTGQVNSDNERAIAERFAKNQDNVKSVVNDLTIAPEPSLTQRAKDQLITTQVRAVLVQAKDVHSSAVHIVTQNGVVYLMGRLTLAEGNRVSNLVSTSQVSGVQKVVKVFETISEEDLQRLVAPSRR